jgi:hypothetical protein
MNVLVIMVLIVAVFLLRKRPAVPEPTPALS